MFSIDLRSDTFSVPCDGMRKAISEAAVGDDVFGEDQLTNSLESRVAELTGKEAGLFVPSGTMGNGLGIRTLGSPGQRILCGANSHVYNYEGDQFALNCGMQMQILNEKIDGMLPIEKINKVFSKKEDIHRSKTGILALENTHNLLGGLVVPQKDIKEACDIAHSFNSYTYLDGARLWHTHIATDLSLRHLAEPFDMLSLCFSKGLGAPVGSVLVGTKAFIEKARWFRKRMGGGMRQTGILTSACHFALDNNLSRLGLTHEYAKALADAFIVTGKFKINKNCIDTNIVFMQTEKNKAEESLKKLDKLGLKMLTLNNNSIRFVTHLSLKESQVKEAIKIIEKEF